MGLELILGPANAGKVAALYTRFLDALDDGGAALLIVPTADSSRRAERELLARRRVLVGGEVLTFDRVFERISARCGADRRAIGTNERRARLERLIASAELEALAGSARGARFVDVLGRHFDRLASALVDPGSCAATAVDAAGRELADLYRCWWDELDAIDAWDAARMRYEAVALVERSLDAWGSEPLFVQGFEDLSRAQELLVRRVAERASAVMTLPYEPGRMAFRALKPSVDRLTEGAAHTELPPLADERPAVLRRLERRLFEPPAQDGAEQDADRAALELLEVAGARAEAEAIVREVAEQLRAGVPAESIAIVVPGDAASRPVIVEALEAAAVPLAAATRPELAATPFGHALDRLLGAAWDDEPTRADLYTFLRSPWSGRPRRSVDFAEGRLRGRSLVRGREMLEETAGSLGGTHGLLAVLQREGDPLDAVEHVVRRMASAALGLEGRAPTPDRELELACADAALAAVAELRDAGEGPALGRRGLRRLLQRAVVSPRVVRRGRVQVVGPREARGLALDCIIVVGLESGGLDAAGAAAEALPAVAADGSPLGSDPVDLVHHRLYTALTRASRRVVLVRRYADDAGQPIERSALLEAVIDAVGPLPASSRRLADLTWPIAAAPTDRDRLRAVVRIAVDDPGRARSIAARDGTTRPLQRAISAFHRANRLSDPVVLAQLGEQQRYNVTALEAFSDCSSIWFIDRHLAPKEMDRGWDAKLIGTLAHGVLNRFYKALPATFGRDRLEPGDADRAAQQIAALVRDSVAGQRLPTDTLEARLVERRLVRDLSAFVRRDAATPSQLVPTRFEVSFGGATAAAGLKEGLPVGDAFVTGKIDRIDTDVLFATHGLIQDYKLGARVQGAREIRENSRLQLPLYARALRDLLGLEPIGGVYRSLSPAGAIRGVVDREQADRVPAGLPAADLVDDLWERVREAEETVVQIVGRIRAGDIRTDPRGGSCPDWCARGSICRVGER